jgi:hypothetical protein
VETKKKKKKIKNTVNYNKGVTRGYDCNLFGGKVLKCYINEESPVVFMKWMLLVSEGFFG